MAPRRAGGPLRGPAGVRARRTCLRRRPGGARAAVRLTASPTQTNPTNPAHQTSRRTNPCAYATVDDRGPTGRAALRRYHRGGGHYNNHSSNTTKQELPVHPNLREHHNIWNQGGDGDWKVSTDTHTQAARHERQAAADALAKTSAVSSKTTKMTMTQGRDYKGPQQVEDERIEKLRSL